MDDITYRNRRLLDLAHDMPCQAKFPHPCTSHLGCVPAHANWQVWGRGFSHKANDFAFAAMCQFAHDELDRHSVMDDDQKQIEWTLAHVSTMRYLWENELIKVA